MFFSFKKRYVDISGHISGNTITLEPFTLEHSFATGYVYDISTTFDEEVNTFNGDFQFRLDESSAFSAYEGMTFGGSISIGLD